MFANHDMWRVTRNAWQPFFSREAVDKTAGLMATLAARLAARLGAAADSGAEVDIHTDLGLMTMAVVGSSAFGCALRPAGRLAGW